MLDDTENTRHFLENGWLKFPYDAALHDWVRAVLPAARKAVDDPENAGWLRCDGTWFAGVNVLDNDAAGAAGSSGPLRGSAVDFLRRSGLPVQRWDRGQVSVIYPGYPRRGAGESDAAFRFRRDRDAAHIDGLLPIGPEKRRMLREPHAFVLGVALNDAGAGAAPLVVWQGSHRIIRRDLGAVLRPKAVQDWPGTDLSDAYQGARREIFEVCPRVALPIRPGEAYLIHRLALHGVAPWPSEAPPLAQGRMIAYFRPELTGPIKQWVTAA